MSQPAGRTEYMSRGLLTPAEKRAIRGEESDTNKHSTYIARVKRRMELVEEDARLLRAHRPDLYERLHGAVCEEDLDERVQRLEQEVSDLREQVSDQSE